MPERSCGRLRRAEDGRWFYGEIQVGLDGELDEETLARAVQLYRDDAVPGAEPWKPPPMQLSFSWPVEAPPLVNVDAGLTVAQAHADLWPRLDKGAFCPVCQRMARRYARPFHKEMAACLVHLVKAFVDGGERHKYFELRKVVPGNLKATKASSDGAYLPQWKLIKRHPKRTGLYMPTPAGVAFVRGQTRVPKFAWIYDAQAHHFSKEQISITEALANQLDVQTMLRDIAGYEGR